MLWSEAKEIIKNEIRKGTDINTEKSSLRIILEVEYPCWKYDYKGEYGFLIRISNIDSNNLEIPWSMLEKAFKQLGSAEGYNRRWFEKVYPKQCREHGCHIHVIGRIFEKAGIAYSLNRTYKLISKEV